MKDDNKESVAKTRSKYSGPGGALAWFYHTILNNQGVDLERYDALMRRYIARAHLRESAANISQARASLNKELMKTSITWKTFIKGLLFLSVWKVEISVKLFHTTGLEKESFHSVTFELDENDGEDTIEKE